MIRSKKGFTLVELLVVIAIIAIISAVAVPVVISQIDKAKIATVESETQNAVSAVQNAAVAIASDKAAYPDGVTEANMLAELNKSFIGIKQLKSINIVANADGATSHVTVTAKEDVKKNGQSIVLETDYAVLVPAEFMFYVTAAGGWSLTE